MTQAAFPTGRKGCELCTDHEGEEPWYPMYGVAPHDCYWRKGPQYQLGQSTLVPFRPEDCFVPELKAGETWADFGYPSACGVYYCPKCDRERYEAAWSELVARVGEPPENVGIHEHESAA